jgi:hypothetical protein
LFLSLITYVIRQTYADIVNLKHEKNALKLSVKELQSRLTQAETNGGGPAAISAANVESVEAAMRRSEREKDLEKQVGHAMP